MQSLICLNYYAFWFLMRNPAGISDTQAKIWFDDELVRKPTGEIRSGGWWSSYYFYRRVGYRCETLERLYEDGVARYTARMCKNRTKYRTANYRTDVSNSRQGCIFSNACFHGYLRIPTTVRTCIPHVWSYPVSFEKDRQRDRRSRPIVRPWPLKFERVSIFFFFFFVTVFN